jgi:hypothetical protein
LDENEEVYKQVKEYPHYLSSYSINDEISLQLIKRIKIAAIKECIEVEK